MLLGNDTDRCDNESTPSSNATMAKRPCHPSLPTSVPRLRTLVPGPQKVSPKLPV
jgi:hypothetical protein